MTETPHIAMHHDHQRWAGEIDAWRDDLRMWQQQLAAAQGAIQQLARALDEHRNVLRIHASALRLEEQDFGVHEHALVQFEKGDEEQDLPALARHHGQVTARQAELRAAHERLKHHHHQVMARWAELLKAVGEHLSDQQP